MGEAKLNNVIKRIFKTYGNYDKKGTFISPTMFYHVLALLESGTKEQQSKVIFRIFDVNYYDPTAMGCKEFLFIAIGMFNMPRNKANKWFKGIAKQGRKISSATYLKEFLDQDRVSFVQKRAAIMIEVLYSFSIAVQTLRRLLFGIWSFLKDLNLKDVNSMRYDSV